MICVRIIFVEKFFAHYDSGLNAWFVMVITSGSGKASVNVIHSWYLLHKVGCCTRKKRGSVFENLEQQVSKLKSKI